MPLAYLTFLLATSTAASITNESSSFCDRVQENHGCCPHCGYTWEHGKCVTKNLPPTTQYCKMLLQPSQHGCCKFCGYAWEESASGGKCIGPGGPTSTDVLLATFGGTGASNRSWVTINDPVMGGASISNIATLPEEKVGLWAGEVKIVHSLGAPGFCTLRTAGDELFPDSSATKYIGLTLTGGSGLPAADFSLQVAVKGVTEGMYQAQLANKYCCADDCRVPWDAFKLSFRGQPVKGPPLTEHLDGITQLGLGTAGTAGKFSLKISSFYATPNATRPCSMFV